MEVKIRAENLAVAPELRSLVEEKVARVERLLDTDGKAPQEVDVHLFEERNHRIADKEICEMTVRSHGRVVRAHGAATEPLAAIDLVVDKLEHRLARLKNRLVGRSHPRRRDNGGAAGAPLLPAGSEGQETAEEGSAPRIVRVRRPAAKPMTPDEAALQMQVSSSAFLLFTDAESGRAAVVYRRRDGDIGLIDSN